MFVDVFIVLSENARCSCKLPKMRAQQITIFYTSHKIIEKIPVSPSLNTTLGNSLRDEIGLNLVFCIHLLTEFILPQWSYVF